MQMLPRTSYPQRALKTQEKHKAREAWHKLVVKILGWKDGVRLEKITLKEWKTYYQGLVKISTLNGRKKTVEKLEAIKEIIKKNGGFGF